MADLKKTLQAKISELDKLEQLSYEVSEEYGDEIVRLRSDLYLEREKLAIEQGSNGELEDLPKETESILRWNMTTLL